MVTALLRTRHVISSAMQDPREDPLSQALQPPPGESEADRLLRLQILRAAEQISREIDASILESKKEFERRKKAIKILLLGISFPRSLFANRC
jgi:hypothetical protein